MEVPIIVQAFKDRIENSFALEAEAKAVDWKKRSKEGRMKGSGKDSGKPVETPGSDSANATTHDRSQTE